jgi:hypothetical protein
MVVLRVALKSGIVIVLYLIIDTNNIYYIYVLMIAQPSSLQPYKSYVMA